MNMGHLHTLSDTLSLARQWWRFEKRKSRVRAGQDTHLALLAWALPPNSNAGVHRPLSFLRYGALLGWRIDSFQGEVPANQSQHGGELLARVPSSVRRHLVPRDAREPSYRFSPRIDGGFKNALAFAQRAVTELAGDPPNVVLASGPPFFVFVAGLFVARHFDVPLVLDYRDEWSECPFDFVANGGHDAWWERRCLAAASAVLFTTESHRQHQLALFPELKASRAHLIPNGWEPDDFAQEADASPEPRGATDSFTLAHVGNLAGHTPPQGFLSGLAQLLRQSSVWQSRLRVQFIGRRSAMADAAIQAFDHPQALEITDHVSKRQANRRMQVSDALLLITTQDLARYLPGKLFDYVAAGRPVLMVGEAGESSRLLEKLGVGVLSPAGDGVALGEALARLEQIDMNAQRPLVQEWLEQHRREALATRTFDILASLRTSP